MFQNINVFINKTTLRYFDEFFARGKCGSK